MIGKKVIITGPRSKEDYDLWECRWLDEMDIFIGEEATITKVYDEYFDIDADDGKYQWSEKWVDMKGV